MPDSSAYQTGYAVGFITSILLTLGIIGVGLFSIVMAFVRRTKGWIAMAIVFSLLGAGVVIAGAVFAIRGVSKSIAEQSKSKRVVSNDGWVSLEVPGSWSTMRELHEDASLKLGSRFREEYAVVISTTKSDFDGKLDEFAEAATGQIRKNLGPSAEVGGIEDGLAGRFPAKRCRLAGKVQNVRIVYLHYSIETPEAFHQVIMWTLPSKERAAWPAFERVAGTFEVVNPPKTEALQRSPSQASVTPRTGTVEERLRAIIVEQLGVTAERVKPNVRLNELGADELDLVELVMASEEEFEIEIRDDDAEKLTTVEEFADYVSERLRSPSR